MRQRRPVLKGGDSRTNARGKHTANPGWEAMDHWLVCDLCGCDIRSSEARERWDGYVVCPDDWEPRQEQDFVRAHEDTIAAQGLVRLPNDDIDSQWTPPGAVIPPVDPTLILYDEGFNIISSTELDIFVSTKILGGTLYAAVRTSARYTESDIDSIVNGTGAVWTESLTPVLGVNHFSVTGLTPGVRYYIGFVQLTP